ncbi:ATP-binding protein [Candidatus Venteria ishoeyi]|uniref:NB-ARC domain-containing protein n=1 Tax=Candidatus Venteria ishoeyi TaxID=1899563 RepID=A0A1H6FC18_9GAMM|nr:ATP-binding protein [Candidatus Venteria ishoeyi]SEH07193.1 Uncharacterised protein [Candidatus Venteria ishoeyi]
MNRNWTDFKSLHGNIAGAREAFENACETLYRKKHKDENVSQVRVNQGDGGIDIFIGELGVEPITVIQCKFFLESFGDSQKQQIRESFNTSVNSDKYELKEWVLCIPRVFDMEESSWWSKWKDNKVKEYSKENSFIRLANGNELIDLSKELGLYNEIFKITDSLKIEEIHNAIVHKENRITQGVKPNIVLFNNYTSKNEDFYLERYIDIEFNKSFEINNIWLFGKSGVGKTALANRNLIKNKIKYCFCDLSPITISKAEDVLDDILCTVEEDFDSERNLEESNILKQISQILYKSKFNKIVILIDEISVKDDEVLKDIANKLIQLVTYCTKYSNQDGLKFIVSTISNPQNIIQNKSKASDYFQYVCCDMWNEYLFQLFDVLCKALNLELEKSKSLIIENSENSPRVLKTIFRKILTSKDCSSKSIDKAIKLTLEEII